MLGITTPEIRVLGIRNHKFVEFEFSLEKDLSVELIMPFSAFDDFCRENNARVIASSEERLHAGLYLTPEQRPENK